MPLFIIAMALVSLLPFTFAAASTTVVAVVDSGVDTSHPKLADNLWSNPGEAGVDDEGRNKSSNGKDDDHNGYVDDVHGWDFVLNRPATVDPVGHGTHVAGLIKGEGPANPDLKIMSLRYFSRDQTGAQNLAKSIAAIDYAIQMNVDIINYSGGGPVPDRAEKAALQRAALKNILVVAAAGNESRDLTLNGFFPASYGFSNILSVAAVGRAGSLSRHSNFSSATVHLTAAGEAMNSTLPNNREGTMSGTSQATAVVAGAAARLVAQNPSLRHNPQKLILRLMNLGQLNRNLYGKVVSPVVIGGPQSNPHAFGGDVDAFGKPLPPLAL